MSSSHSRQLPAHIQAALASQNIPPPLISPSDAEDQSARTMAPTRIQVHRGIPVSPVPAHAPIPGQSRLIHLDNRNSFKVHYFSAASNEIGVSWQRFPAPMPLAHFYPMLMRAHPTLKKHFPRSLVWFSLHRWQSFEMVQTGREPLLIMPGANVLFIPEASHIMKDTPAGHLDIPEEWLKGEIQVIEPIMQVVQA